MKEARTSVAAAVVVLLLTVMLLGTACAKPAPTAVTSPAAAPKQSPTQAAVPAAKQAQLPKSLIVGSTPIGTSTYVVCTGLATVIQKYTGMKCIVQPIATTPLQYNELFAGRLNLGVLVQGTAYVVFRGLAEYKDAGPRPLRRLGDGNASAYVWITRPDTGIKSIRDMVGKKAAYLSGVNVEVTDTFRLCLEYYGIADKVIGINRSSMESAAEALIEKKVDVIGGPHGSFAYNVQNATGMVVIPIDEKATGYIAQKMPELCTVVGTFPAGYYAMPEKITTCARVKEMLVVPGMSDEVAYSIVKAICDHPEDTKAIHRDVGEFNLEQAQAYSVFVPTHPGAIRYFKEKGVWTAAHEETQKKLLAEEQQLLAKKK